MHLYEIVNMENYDCSYNDDSLDIVEREESSYIGSKYSDNANSTLLREQLINKKIENALQRNFVINIAIEGPEKIAERENSRNIFVLESVSSRRRGRKILDSTKSSKKKTHSADDWDNNLRKIQVHFLNFVIFYLNDIIYSHLEIKERKDLFFLKFNIFFIKCNIFINYIYFFMHKNIHYNDGYPSKSDVNYEYVEKLKSYNIKELLENLDSSPKYKRIKIKKEENINKNKLNDLCRHDWFNELIKMKFLDLFKIYYNQKNPLREIFFNRKKITLSKINNFYALLLKYKNYEEKLIEVAEAVYLNY